MPSITNNPRYRVGDDVVKRDDDRIWHVYEVLIDTDEKYSKYYVYLIHTRSKTMNEFGGYGTEYGEARASELKKAGAAK